jgi:hypothetical protein
MLPTWIRSRSFHKEYTTLLRESLKAFGLETLVAVTGVDTFVVSFFFAIVCSAIYSFGKVAWYVVLDIFFWSNMKSETSCGNWWPYQWFYCKITLFGKMTLFVCCKVTLFDKITLFIYCKITMFVYCKITLPDPTSIQSLELCFYLFFILTNKYVLLD